MAAGGGAVEASVDEGFCAGAHGGEVGGVGGDDLLDGLDGGFGVVGVDAPADLPVGDDVGDVAGVGAEQEDGAGDGHGAVDFAGVGDADGPGSDDDEVDVGGGEGVFELVEGLIGQGADVGGAGGLDEIVDGGFADAAADEQEQEAGVVTKMLGSFEDGVDRGGVADVAGIHDDELVDEAAGGAEGIVGVIEGGQIVGGRPGGKDGEFVGDVELGAGAVGHEAIEGDDVAGAAEDGAVERVEAADGEGGGFEAAHDDGLIGIDVHDPIGDGHATEGPDDECGGGGERG